VPPRGSALTRRCSPPSPTTTRPGSARADPQRLGTGLLAALQGGYVLAQNAHSSEPMAVALDMALDHIASFARG
ncbi:hypothetical protein ACWEC4_40815, partial [Streptomyces sp. NPDC005055]